MQEIQIQLQGVLDKLDKKIVRKYLRSEGSNWITKLIQEGTTSKGTEISFKIIYQ